MSESSIQRLVHDLLDVSTLYSIMDFLADKALVDHEPILELVDSPLHV